jgi:drug/metabolite transporter (DMT)-like permease
MIAALWTTVFFSLSAVTANRSVRYMGGNEANFWRLLVATTLLGVFSHVWGVGLAGAFLPWFLLSGVIGFGLGDLALFQAYPRIGSRLTVLLVHCLAAPMAMTAEWLWLGNAVTVVEAACGFTILAGLAVALIPPKPAQPTERRWSSGVLFATIAAMGQGGGAVVSRKAYAVAEATDFPLVGVAGGLNATYQRILAGLAIAALGVLLARRHAVFAHFGRLYTRPAHIVSETQWARAWPWIVLNGLAGPALGVACFQLALQTTKSGVVLPIVALTPLVVVPFARYLEGEKPTMRSLIGGLMAVSGVVLLTQAERLYEWLNFGQ